MAETLIRNGDEDDYSKVGTFELELHANGVVFEDVSAARRHREDILGRRYSVMPAAGFLAVRKAGINRLQQ